MLQGNQGIVFSACPVINSEDREVSVRVKLTILVLRTQEDFEAFIEATPLRISPHFSPSLQGALEIIDFLC